MEESRHQGRANSKDTGSGTLGWLFVGGFLLIIFGALLLPKQKENLLAKAASQNDTTTMVAPVASVRSAGRSPIPHQRPGPEPTATAEEIVASKVSQFTRNRRELLNAMSLRFKIEVPEEVRRFFDAVEGGRWEEIRHSFELLNEKKQSTEDPEGLRTLWPLVLETFGTAEQAHEWPAQRLLDYGHSILDSLRPGMVYVGGTDPGRFIPTLLNETDEGEHHIILTQNALADNSYLQYAGFLYGDRIPLLSAEDSQQAFQDYISDAQKRFMHDQQFPEEPKQVRPGEDIHMEDNRLMVSGQIAVMAINEKLLQAVLTKNPDLSFAIEQSFPFTSTYEDAAPLGPIMELRAQADQNVLTRERAGASLDYWRATAQQLLSDPEAANSPAVLQAWSKMAVEQADLFLNRKFIDEAEQTFQLANELCPSSPETVFRYVNLLLQQNRTEDAVQIASNGANAAPENKQLQNLMAQLRNMKRN